MSLRGLAAAAACAAASAATLTLTGDEVWVVSGNESAAVQNALRDVRRDAYKVFAISPIVLGAPPAPGSLPAGTTVLYFGTPAAAPWLSSLAPANCFAGWESHCVVASTIAGYASIVATGTGDRGGIFAGYTFSEAVLGVNPLYRVTDDEPAYAGSVAYNASLAVFFAPPVWKFRGLFINDEDLLANAFPDHLLKAAIDNRAYEEYYETILRLKGNTVLPATNPFPDADVYALCAARGLVCTHHHYDLLGADVFSWPLQGQDWDYRRDPGTMAALWRSAIEPQIASGAEIMWSVGLRGLNDISYRACDSDEQCGALITQAMANQTAWIRALDPNATIVTYMWQENLGYLTQGYLQIPEGVKVLFTDAGVGYIRVDANFSTLADGVYYHTMMYDGSGNQLSESIPLDRIIAQFKTVLANASHGTDIVIDNASDLKPVPMTTQLLMQFCWDPQPFMRDDENATALAFYAAWGARQHAIPGGAAAPAAQAFAALWRDFFLVPYVQTGLSDNFLSNALQAAPAQAAASIVAGQGVTPAQVAAMTTAAGKLGGADAVTALSGLLARAEALQPQLPASRQGFFASHTALQIAMHYHGASAIVACADALTAGAAGNWSGAAASAQAALASMDALVQMLRAGEAASGGSKWAAWFMGDTLTYWQAARVAVRQLVQALAAGNNSKAPLAPQHPGGWYTWEAYQSTPSAQHSYPYIRSFSPDWSFSVFVRQNCDWADIDAGACAPNPDGGLYAPGKGARVTLQVGTSQTGPEGAGAGEGQGQGEPWAAIRYTLDGTAPTAASPAYTPGSPIQLDAACPGGKPCAVNVTAASFGADGAMLSTPRSTLWLPTL